MRLRFLPQRRDEMFELERRGECLIVNGQELDFSSVPDGGVATPADIGSAWLAENVRRENGQIEVTLFLPLEANAPESRRFPEPVLAETDGPIALPQDSPAKSEENPDR
jgi:hypothetical protein